jgi:hypothetical protein
LTSSVPKLNSDIEDEEEVYSEPIDEEILSDPEAAYKLPEVRASLD